MRPLCIDLYCGLGGWAEGFLSEGYDVIGFDIVMQPYPGQRVLQDVLTLHGSQFKDAACIVGSSPCQEFSYRAMPWKRAKALPPPYLGMELFEAQFRIQREASEAAGRYIPMVVENVKGAQKWVGSARWHYGPYYLWGDVPALMPFTTRGSKNNGGSWFLIRDGQVVDRHDPRDVRRQPDGSWGTPDGVKVPGLTWSDYGKPGYKPKGFNVTAAQRYREETGHKQEGSGPEWFDKGICKHGSRTDSRKAASAAIAKIPYDLAVWIAHCFKSDAMSHASENEMPRSCMI